VKDGKIYKGNSDSYNSVIANVKDGKVREGNSESYNSVLFTYDDDLTLLEFVAVFHAFMYTF